MFPVKALLRLELLPGMDLLVSEPIPLKGMFISELFPWKGRLLFCRKFPASCCSVCDADMGCLLSTSGDSLENALPCAAGASRLKFLEN